jgi:hypothetical protein
MRKDQTIFRLGISGGPNAGKTLLIGYLYNIFTNLGYKVLIIPEAATFWMQAGIPQGSVFFQEIIFKYMLLLEDSAVEFAKTSNESVIILCDRTILDGMAYFDKNDYEKILSNYGLSVKKATKRYDGVLYLETAAKGAAGFFGKKTNDDRYEDVKGAIETCKKTLKALSYMPKSKFRKVRNDGGTFISKLFSAYQSACDLMNLPIPTSNSKKFLLNDFFIESLDGIDYTKVIVTCDFLPFKEGAMKPGRLRTKEHGEDIRYFFTQERRVDENEFFQIEKDIPRSKYLDMLLQKDHSTKTVKKTRISFESNGNLFEIDYFDQPFKYNGKEHNATLRVVSTKKNGTIKIPAFLKTGIVLSPEEVSDYKISKQ